ncbi:patatin-like phospholipase family protein [Reyranella sp.]|uniref:patatin-like phospholipase family protein n=1 Tax=Reyranella sp. TaxID=1929291 RepID=UPI003BAB941A
MTAGGACAAIAPGCATPARGPALPRDKLLEASVLGLPNERFYPVLGSEALAAEFVAAGERQMARQGVASLAELKLDLLAVSGGGEDGAFGAGLLCGWTEHGDRPTFDVVTGVSTGSLTAPFAYLGSGYDPQLRYVYTGITAADVLRERGVTAALFDDALADNAPLFQTISRVLDDRMLQDIARAYQSGRLLLIGTTNLDAQQPVIWNIGAIAASGHPRAADTIRRILLASAAVPGAFPPTLFDVTSGDKSYQEMHVDGGAFVQSFLYPATLTTQRRQRMAAHRPVATATAYIIRNGRLDPDWADVRREMLGITGRAISTMIVASGYNDTVRIYYTTQRDKVAYNLAYIGPDFTGKLPKPFDQDYMRALYDYGYQRARNGYPWARRPPLVE